MWPHEHARQVQELDAEMQEQWECQWLPLVTPMLAFPGQPCNLHIVQPQHRLLIRRRILAGAQSFGVCLLTADGRDIQEYGTEVTIRSSTSLNDGRSLVEAVGSRRFRVTAKSWQDGYPTAKVEFIEDTDEQSSKQQLRQQLVMIHNAMASLGELLGRSVLDVPTTPWLDIKEGDDFAWALLFRLPLAAEGKAHFLAMTTKMQRFAALHDVLVSLETAAREFANREDE